MKKTTPVITPTIVHDHFDGTANCIECGGNCELVGSDLLATQLIRFSFYYLIVNGWKESPPPMFVYALEEAGVDWKLMWQRAKDTTPLPRRK